LKAISVGSAADRRKEGAVALVLGDTHAAPLFITAS